MAEKGGSRTLREPYGSQTGFEDQRHHRAPSFSTCKMNWLARKFMTVKTGAADGGFQQSADGGPKGDTITIYM
jgi:hypothetical protein